MAKSTAFPATLRMLREKEKISQKSAASSLGISQALLSHYEKGIRECGLEFLIKAADFYNVTADFLLGRHSDAVPDRAVEIPEQPISSMQSDIHKDCELNWGDFHGNGYAVLYKNMISKASEVLFSSLRGCENRDLSKICGEFLNVSVYILVLSLEKNISPEMLADAYSGLFSLNKTLLDSLESPHWDFTDDVYIINSISNAKKILGLRYSQ